VLFLFFELIDELFRIRGLGLRFLDTGLAIRGVWTSIIDGEWILFGLDLVNDTDRANEVSAGGVLDPDEVLVDDTSMTRREWTLCERLLDSLDGALESSGDILPAIDIRDDVMI
jgi:hypothetical protein